MTPATCRWRRLSSGLLLAVLLAGGQARGAEGKTVDFDRDVAPLLKQFCIDCHGPEKAKADFRIDQLSASPVKRSGLEAWSEVAEQIKAGVMPPPKSAQPSVGEVGVLMDWAADVVRKGAARLKPRQHHTKRRMTKAQYTATLQDLTGLPLQFGKVLPDDSPGPSGFTNDVETLGFTSAHSEQLLAASQAAVSRILPRPTDREFDSRTDYNFVLDFEEIGKLVEANRFDSKERESLRRNQAVVIPVDPDDLRSGLVGADYGHHERGRSFPFGVAAIWSAPHIHWINAKKQLVQIELAQFRHGMYVAPHGNHKIGRRSSYPQGSIRLARGGYATSGWAKITVTAAAEIAPGDKPPQMIVTIRLTEDLNNRTVQRPPVFTAVRTVSAPVGRAMTFTFMVCLDNLGLLSQVNAKVQDSSSINGSSPKKLVDLGGVPPLISVYNGKHLPDDQDGKQMYPTRDGTKLLLKRVAVEWPCEPPTNPAERLGLVIPETSNPDVELSSLRPSFDKALERIWRRPIDEKAAEPIYDIYRAARKADQSPRQAVAEALTAGLCSPHFLYLDQSTRSANTPEDGRLTEYAIAERLSYFLWNSMPDQRLMELARKGQLADPEVRATEAIRMLADPRSKRFVNQFMDQWMMRGLDGIAVDTDRFTDFSEAIRGMLRTEARLFLGHLMHEDLPLVTLLNADFRIVNRDLARYYGIDSGDYTNTFRKVDVPAGTPTAGVLTLGAPLIVRGSGMESSPFARGAWVLSSILGTPPPSPPPSVPDLPKDSAFEKLPLREKLAIHRSAPSCASCHSRIDPWGIALEHYDASGRRRARYVDLARSTISQDRGTRSKFVFGKPVLSEANLRDGTAVTDVAGVRDAILNTKRRSLFVKHIARLLLSYSIGRSLMVEDQASLQDLTNAFKEGDVGLRSAIIHVVKHAAFVRP